MPTWYLSNRGFSAFNAIGRLKDNVTISEASAELESIANVVKSNYPENFNAPGNILEVVKESNSRMITHVEQYQLYLIILVVSLMLALLAIGNVCNLFVGEILKRKKELATRHCLGANERNLLLNLCFENLFVAILCVLGTLIAFFALSKMASAFLEGLELSINAYNITAVIGIIGVMLLVQTTMTYFLVRRICNSAYRSSGRYGKSGEKTRAVLVLTQVIMSSALLTISMFFTSELKKAWELDVGFNKENLNLVQMHIKSGHFTEKEAANYFKTLRKYLEDTPEIESVGIAATLPLSGSNWSNINIEGYDSGTSNGGFRVNQIRIGPHFLEMIGVQLIKGRFTTWSDHYISESAEVNSNPLIGMVNEAFVEKFYPSSDPLNQIIYKGDERRSVQIVGVVGNYRTNVFEKPEPAIFIPYVDSFAANRRLFLHIRKNPMIGNANILIKERISNFNSSIPVLWSDSIEQFLESEFQELRVGALITLCLSLIGVLVTFVGIWTVYVAKIRSQRKSIGVRYSLGATHGSLVRVYVGAGILLSLTGSLIGISLAIAVSRRFGNILSADQLNLYGAPSQVLMLMILMATVSIGLSLAQIFRRSPAVLLKDG